MGDEDESDWVFDHVMHFFKSAEWDHQVMGYIDNNCSIFVNDEENKFEYTDIHKAFVVAVEKLIDEHLMLVGISGEMFVDACQRARNTRDINKEVYEQMVAMDDFLTFKKLMVKRNVELGYEALQELQKEQVPIIAPETEEEAESQFQRAVKESEDMSVDVAHALIHESERAEAKESFAASAATPGQEHIVDRQILSAMDAHLMEMEVLHKREEMEQLELEQAIAESLAIETERVNVRCEDADAADAAEQQPACASRSSSQEEEAEAKPTVVVAPVVADEKRAPARLVVAYERPAQVAEPKVPTPRASPRDQKREAVSAKTDDDAVPRAAAAPEVKVAARPRASPREAAASAVPPSLAPLPARASQGAKEDALPSLSAKLPSIAELQKEMKEKRRKAEEAFKRNQDLLRQQRAQEREMQERAGVTPEDMRRRQAQLAEQRDRILAKKNAERARKLEQAQQSQPQSANRAAVPVCDVKESPPVAAAGAKESGESEERRAMMRTALARRMKQDLLENEEQRLRKMQSEQFTELDRKLRLVERLRDENRVKEMQLADAISMQQTQRFKNIKLSAARMTADEYN